MQNAIIIGGGICGLTTALALSRVGIGVKVFERTGELREIGAGLTLWANGVYALSKIALNEPVTSQGQIASTFRFASEQGRTLGSVDMKRIEKKMGVPSISIDRRSLMNVLVDRVNASPSLKGAIHLSHEFESYNQNGSSVTANFSNGHSEQADMLLACDGFHSRVRMNMLKENEPARSQPRYSGYTCWRGVANVGDMFVEPGVIIHYFARGAQFGILDTGHGNVCWYGTGNVPKGIKEHPDQRKRDVLARFAKFAAPVPELLERTAGESFLKNDIYDREPLDKWMDERVLLLGDAAHPTTPNLGQGACQAIEDAVVFSQCVSQFSDNLNRSNQLSYKKVFRAFCRLRQERTKKIVLASRKSGEIGQIDNPFICSLRDMTMEAMIKLANLRDFEEAVLHKV